VVDPLVEILMLQKIEVESGFDNNLQSMYFIIPF